MPISGQKRKYGNKKVRIEGRVFDSQGEHRRWLDLVMMERVGVIKDLKRQVPIELAPSAKLVGSRRARPAVRVVVDFSYFDKQQGRQRYEDFKGVETPVSLLKRHLAKTVHNIDIEIVGARHAS
jgi:hypothetical protein